MVPSPKPYMDDHPRVLDVFEEIYKERNRPEFIHPDPLEFVSRFDDPDNQEVAGMIASALAFGRVGHILKNLETVFRILRNPASDLQEMSREDLKHAFGSFRHRWSSGGELADLLFGIRSIRGDYGSLENFFVSKVRKEHRDVVMPLAGFVDGLKNASGNESSSLLPCPTMGSACKRLMLYLRWMVRKDEVDPGPWTGISPSILVVPMDTHMFRVSRALGLTTRRQADLKCALEVTSFFRSLVPMDPVRYDFALTRAGIRNEGGVDGILERFSWK